MTARKISAALALGAATACLAFFLPGSTRAAGTATAGPAATSWTVNKFVQPQPACTGVAWPSGNFSRIECGFGYAAIAGTNLTGTTKSIVKVGFFDRDGKLLASQTATARTTAGSEGWQFTVQPASTWPAGDVTIRVTDVDVDGAAGAAPNQSGNFGETTFVLNGLGASIAPGAGDHKPGEALPVNGTIYEIQHVSVLVNPTTVGVAGSASVQVRTPDGQVRGPYGPFTADSNGAFHAVLPAAATAGITATAETGYKTTASLEVVNATYDDPVSGRWEAKRGGAGALPLFVQPTTLLLENAFVSDVGWVKPGDSYPFRVFVRNYMANAATGAKVTIAAPDGTSFVNAVPATGSGTATTTATSITWSVGGVPAAAGDVPAIKTLIVEAKSKTLGQDPQIVWKNLSSKATLTYDGGPTLSSTSEGPKVIPPKATYETARYGYRPFAVVPADWSDRKHTAAHTSEALREKINSPDLEGSTFKLYQEMSYGQLFPHGTVASAGIATAGWDVQWKSDRFKQQGWHFSDPLPGGACYGATKKALVNTPVLPERIKDGWYQLPGDTAYYGGDADSFANVVQPNSAFIDSACGPIGKAVFDAAQIADPEIDYSDYDTDKDGVVDFFMLVFAGIGGNGASQLNVPPYDNIWPHSSSLENYYTDPETKLKGYISDDQLKDLEGRLMYYTDASRTQMTHTVTQWPVYVRVGPYNVNPEAAIDHASVISHEYGHSLGLPDYYSSPGSGRETYGDWMLMATDKSQNMDVNGKQELGWLIPRVLKAGDTTVNGWHDTKTNTHRIDWVQPNGAPYTLTGAGVNNGEAYVAKLPGKKLIDAARVPSGDHVWWSGSGNDFGCGATGGRNLDISIPALATLPAGTKVTLSFKSSWDIEWDFDYGFVLAALNDGNGGVTYESIPSANGYSTPQQFNPNANGCQLQYGNGLTGTSGSWQAGTQTLDRNPLGGAYPGAPFVDDAYDLSGYVGKASAIRLSYTTDPGFARPGWFIDDLKVTLGDGTVLYSSDFEGGADDPALYNGGCNGGLTTANACTAGWQYISSSEDSQADRAYYMEMRDRSGFDFDGHGQIDRDPLGFNPGLLLVYTDETTGYGNTGQTSGDKPNQTPLDSQPEPGNPTPNLNDAAFTADAGKSSFSDSITAARPEGWIDNYLDKTTTYADGNWHLDSNCLSFDVLRMTGNGIGPSTSPGDLEGDVHFKLGAGCGAFDYGFGVPNTAPIAIADAKPREAKTGDPVTFDGSQSYDDRDTIDTLAFRWDTDGDGTFESTGSSVVHTYAKPGTYRAVLEVKDSAGLTATDTVTVTVTAPDLRVTSASAGNAPKKEGDRVTLTATVANTGAAAAPASKTEFLLDGRTLIALVDTPALAAGASATVSASWNTRGVKGEHTITITADKPDTVGEASETNNASTLTVTIKGNKVTNGSFDQPNDAGTAPASWAGTSTSGGTTSYGANGADGSQAASTNGSGSGTALAAPSWASAPIAVAPGQSLDFSVAISSAGASTPASAGIVYLGAVGNVISTVTLATAPLTTLGFQTLESTLTVPLGVSQVKVVLTGSTAGHVVFDDVGLFDH